MESNKKYLRAVLGCFMILTLICGLLYPLLITAIAQIFFPYQANGSMIEIRQEDGGKKVYGSELIGQAFSDPKYLIGRPLGISNLSPVSSEQEILIQKRITGWREIDPIEPFAIPADLVLASGSGVDPHISPEAADFQVARIARVRNVDENTIRQIIEKNTDERLLGFWGEPGVNVLKVNLELDGFIK